MKLHTQTLQAAEASKDSSLWVLNRTKREDKGRMSINVREANGNQLAIRVMDTWIPQDLTIRAPKKAILESSDFRNLLRQGMLAIVVSTDAQDYMDQDADARAEAKRIFGKGNSFAEVEAAIDMNAERNSSKQNASAMSIDQSGISLKIQNMIAASEADEQYGADVQLAELRSMEEDLTSDELSLLTIESKHASIKSWAAGVLATR